MFESFFKALLTKFKYGEVKSIRYSLILNYSMLISFLVVIIGSANLILNRNILMNNISYYAQQTINETNDKINVALKNIESASKIIISNQKIQKAFLDVKNSGSNNTDDPWESYKAREVLSASLNDISVALVDIHSTGIYFDDKKVYYFGRVGDKSIYDMEPIENKFSLLDGPNQKIVWVPTHYLKNNAQVFTLERKIVDLSNFSVIGILVLNVESRYLTNILNEGQLGKSGSIFLVDSDGVIVGSKAQASIGKKLSYPFINKITSQKEGAFVTYFQGTSMLVAFSTSSYTNWKTVGIVPLSELNSDILKNQWIIVFIGLVGLIVSLVLSIIFASRISAPINKLMSAMKKVENGHMDVTFEDKNFNETKELSEGFQKMVKNLKELISKVYEGELRKKEAEFKALQAQINPHFLYNTLDTINYMLIIEEKYDVSKLVTNLGDILRYNIRKGNDIVTLEEDIEQIEKYLYIQKTRFGERLHYEFDISSDTLKCRILKLLIQPIVENSINHGIEMKRGQGFVKITSGISVDCLFIKVEDNGIGIDEEQLSRILMEEPAYVPIGKSTHLGISNVNRRIKMYYGEKFGIEIQSGKNTGTCVTIFLPVIIGDETNYENIDS